MSRLKDGHWKEIHSARPGESPGAGGAIWKGETAVMFTIRKFNQISDIIGKHLNQRHYEISEDAQHYEGILVRSADLLSAEFPPELVAIARAGAGYNNIPVDHCTEQGIAVFNTPGANANAVKELVLCGLLLAGRRIIDANRWLESLHEEHAEGIEKLVEKGKKQFVGPELMGKTLGVVGLGAIGVMVANAAVQGLGMKVLGYDPYLSVDAAWHLSSEVGRVKSLEEIYTSCDYITLHLPLNDQTRGMIGETAIQSMKPGTVLLNIARGGLVSEKALIAALESGHLRHYVTDFPDEGILGVKGVIATPHLGASTPESEENCAEMAARQLRAFIEDGNIVNSVNLPRCEMPRTGGYRISVINRNIKNMVGQITAALAESGCNIEHMVNSSRGEWAYTMLDLTTAPDQACIDRISAIDGVVRVRTLF